MILYLYLFLLLIIYIFLVNNFIKNKAFNLKIIIALSISVIFIFLFQSIKNNEGYAVNHDLPNSFYVLNSYIEGDNILILIREKDKEPRLYRIKKSIELNRFLKKYNNLKKDGQDVVVKKHNAPNRDSLGMYIESVQKKLPLK